MLSQWFDPEPGPAALPGALARSLTARGHEVQVVTGFPNYPDGELAEGYRISRAQDEAVDGVKIRRVALKPSHGPSVKGRLLNYGSFAASAWAFGVSELQNMDAVWVSNSPVTIGLPMHRLVRHHRVPAVLHVMDLWPDNILSSGMITNARALHTTETAVHRWNRRMYRDASFVAGISPGIVTRLEQRGVPRAKLRHIPMWADEDIFRPTASESARSQIGVDEGRVVVLYAGSLGKTQAIDTLVTACAQYPESGVPIECWIAGGGAEEHELRALAQSHPNPRATVRFLGRVPAGEIGAVMASADMHFVGLRNDDLSSITMPSKIQATMASGKPMIIAVPGDAERVVVEAGAGLPALPGSADSVTDALVVAANLGREGLRRMGEESRRAYEAQFSLKSGTDRIEKLLIMAAEGRR